jgi:hypothetical protein
MGITLSDDIKGILDGRNFAHIDGGRPGLIWWK